MGTGQLLRKGARLVAQPSNEPVVVGEFIAGGGQGEVYHADLAGQGYALKWYFRQNATDRQRENIETLVRKGRPTQRFLWPFQLVTAAGGKGFGYVMPLKPDEYRGLNFLMTRRIEPTFRSLLTGALQLVESFLNLHSNGLCYRDISFDNICIEEATGNILIFDNDNVDIDKREGPVDGTPKFMAPEIVRGEAHPSSQTDLYSMAILLFHMLVFHHPLEGEQDAKIRCFDLPAMRRLYGEEPVFIFDPDDGSNRPRPGLHDNAIAIWPLYPEFIQQTFIRSFTEGIKDPVNGRVRGSQWQKDLSKLRDSLVYCQCGTENFYDLKHAKADGTSGKPCWDCGAQVRLPPRVKVGDLIVMLNHDSVLFPHHVDASRLYEFSDPVAQVAKHPTRELWGLKNLTEQDWTVVMPSDPADVKTVPPGKSVPLMSDARVNFGPSEGRFRV